MALNCVLSATGRNEVSDQRRVRHRRTALLLLVRPPLIVAIVRLPRALLPVLIVLVFLASSLGRPCMGKSNVAENKQQSCRANPSKLLHGRCLHARKSVPGASRVGARLSLPNQEARAPHISPNSKVSQTRYEASLPHTTQRTIEMRRGTWLTKPLGPHAGTGVGRPQNMQATSLGVMVPIS